MRNSSYISLCVAGLAALGHAAPALACSGLPCPPLTLTPRADRAPVNASRFFVSGGSGDRTVVVEEIVAGEVAGSADPATFEVGKRYRVSASSTCGFDDFEQQVTAQPLEFDVIEAVPFPESLGTTTELGRGLGTIPITEGAGCWQYVNVSYVDVQPDFAGVDPALRGVLANYRVLVDGEEFSWELSANGVFEDELGNDPLAGEPWRAPGAFRLWTWCDGYNDDAGTAVSAQFALAAGEHEVYVEATVADANRTILKSSPMQVNLVCPGPTPPADDGGVALDCGVRFDDSTDGGVPGVPPDAGALPDAGTPRPQQIDDCCKEPRARKHTWGLCSVAHGPASAGSAFLLTIAALALVRRRSHRLTRNEHA